MRFPPVQSVSHGRQAQEHPLSSVRTSADFRTTVCTPVDLQGQMFLHSQHLRAVCIHFNPFVFLDATPCSYVWQLLAARDRLVSVPFTAFRKFIAPIVHTCTWQELFPILRTVSAGFSRFQLLCHPKPDDTIPFCARSDEVRRHFVLLLIRTRDGYGCVCGSDASVAPPATECISSSWCRHIL